MSKTGFADKSDEEEIRNNILHMGPDLGVHNVEGQRILQVRGRGKSCFRL